VLGKAGHAILNILAHLVNLLFHEGSVGYRHPPAPAHGDRLELFGSHHGSQAGTACGAVSVVNDTGVADQILAGQAALGHADAFVVQFFAHRPVYGGGLLTPQVIGVADLDVVVLDPQVDRLRGLAGDYYPVPAGPFQLGSPETAYVRLAEPPRERRLGPHGVTAAARHGRAGHHSGGKDQHVLRPQGVGSRGYFFQQIMGDDTPATKVGTV